MKNSTNIRGIYQSALQMEKKGRDFYLQKAEQADEELEKEVFRMLADEEQAHFDWIRRIIAGTDLAQEFAVVLDEFEEEAPQRFERFFKKLVERHKQGLSSSSKDIQALEMGLKLEEQSIRFYQERAEGAEFDAEREFLKRLIEQERGHFQLLSDLKFYRENPSAWFQEKERGGLDGI